ncbi:hypothetical protein DEJ49_04105 [Streptomyces venezuelae]|uniref:Uncharacterized protein n=1 Tax=Streptomyces venezuelae TaxID=54571 RepID=A0A5P2CC16_STRVZ|nr:hypothetical protein [Streptomyces venezuelae]QES40272.1 hypothetical protein DEJ49_04105 [Streptomyces venezuelae]
MAYADDRLGELFARLRAGAARRREQLSVHEAVRETDLLLGRVYEQWEARAEGLPRERCDAVRDAVAAVRVAVCRSLQSVRAAAPVPPHAPHPATGPPRPVRPPNPLVRFLRGGAGEPPPPWAPPPPPPPVVLTDRLFDSIGQALEAVDRSFLSWAAAPPGDPAWHEDDDLVEVLHGLLSAAERGSPDLALAKVVSLRDKLRLQRGMETVVYDPCDPSHTAVLFAFTAPAAPGLPGRCRVPALVHGARVLRRGTVLPLPAPEAAPPAVGPFAAHTDHPPGTGPFAVHTDHPPASEPSLPPPPGHPRPLPPTEEG